MSPAIGRCTVGGTPEHREDHLLLAAGQILNQAVANPPLSRQEGGVGGLVRKRQIIGGEVDTEKRIQGAFCLGGVESEGNGCLKNCIYLLGCASKGREWRALGEFQDRGLESQLRVRAHQECPPSDSGSVAS